MSIFKKYSPEQLENHYSQFLINSWSYSKVSSFARNEKCFEMNYIFGIYGRNSASTVAGQAYHEALRYFFSRFKEGEVLGLIELEQSAFAFIDNVPANFWKLQKTTPTVEECQKKAYTVVSQLLNAFIGELPTYIDDIDEVVDVEVYGDEFIAVNGVDIPLPLHFKIDLIIKTKAGKIAIIDHKSKASYTSEEEMALSIGIQAITYILGYEAKTGKPVDEVWFLENKTSKNKDRSNQINAFKLTLDIDTRRLYEALLYEPLKRMIEAVNNPDHIYLINESDNYVDKAEIYDFWARTMICEVEDFNVEESKKVLIQQRLKKVRDASIKTISPAVIKTFKENASQFIQYDMSNKDMTAAQKIEHVLRSFGTIVRVAHEFQGYSSNTFLLEVSAGVKVSSIYSHRLDIANALDVANVRISKDMVVHEDKSYLAVEFKKKRDRDLIFDESERQGRRLPLGKDNFGNTIFWDLDNPSTPHALVCGQTGSGKSVNLQVMLEHAIRAGVEVYIMDPKREFTRYHDNNQVTVAWDIEDIEEQMSILVKDMESRLSTKNYKKTLIIFDEVADAIANSRKGTQLDVREQVVVGEYANGRPKYAMKVVDTLKSLEENLRIILQKGRSLGFNIVAGTQRASVKIIGGDSKVNFPVRICFQVPTETDSRVILDEPGAETLAGKGDGLISSPEYNQTTRFQSYFYNGVGGETKPGEVEVLEIEEA